MNYYEKTQHQFLRKRIAVRCLLALCLTWVCCETTTIGQDAALTASEQAEIRALVEQLVAFVPTKAELDRRKASSEEYKAYRAKVESLYRKIQNHGPAAIPFVFDLYRSDLTKPDRANARLIIVNLVLGTWKTEWENPVMVSCLSEVLLRDPNPEIREQAVQIIWFRPHLYLDVLPKALADKDEGVGGFVAQAIVSIGCEMKKAEPKIVAFFMRLLEDDRLRFRMHAARGILCGKGFTEAQKKKAVSAVIEKLDFKDEFTSSTVDYFLNLQTGQSFDKYYIPFSESQPSDAQKQAIIKKWKDWWTANYEKLKWDEQKKQFVLPK